LDRRVQPFLGGGWHGLVGLVGPYQRLAALADERPEDVELRRRCAY
jgi:hypothetical protein